MIILSLYQNGQLSNFMYPKKFKCITAYSLTNCSKFDSMAISFTKRTIVLWTNNMKGTPFWIKTNSGYILLGTIQYILVSWKLHHWLCKCWFLLLGTFNILIYLSRKEKKISILGFPKLRKLKETIVLTTCYKS